MNEDTKDPTIFIDYLMKREDRKDPEFRLALLSSQIGDIAKYITHDPALNPNARPHGTKNDEILAYGQVFAMLHSLCYSRQINPEDAIKKGFSHWMDADWRNRLASDEECIRGKMITPLSVSGKAYVVSDTNRLEDILKTEGKHVIVVMKHASPDLMIAYPKALGFVTDHGGLTCHAANIARDLYIPAIVGTGNATSKIKHGDYLSMGPYGAPCENLGEVTIINKPR